MTALELPIPIFATKFAAGYPNPDNDVPVAYAALDVALTAREPSDAHLALYSLPGLPRRLNVEAHPEIGRVPLVAAAFDVDAPGKLADDAWWTNAKDKIAALLVQHPGGFCYRTRGGLRLMFKLQCPIFIDDASDAAAWRALYRAWLNYLERRFGLVGDRACASWNWLYRLPHATRDGVLLELETIGDAVSVGPWSAELSPADMREPPEQPRPPLPRDDDEALYGDVSGVRLERRIELARERLSREPASVTGERGDDRLYVAAIITKCEARLPTPVALDLMREYNRRAEPPWTEDRLIYKLNEAARCATESNGLLLVLERFKRPSAEQPSDAPQRIKPASELLAGLSSRPAQRTFSTGFAKLDELIAGGIKSRQLTTITGPTGAGKTGFAGELALKLSESLPVLFVATEIDGDEQAARFAAQLHHKASPSRFASGAVTADKILAGAAPPDVLRALDGRPVYVLFLEPDERDPIKSILKRMADVEEATGTVPALVIDYLQMLTADDPDGKRLGVSSIANKLRRLAQDLDVPVVAVSSVSRAYYGKSKKDLEGEEDPRAWLATAKESGDVEYASAVLAYLDVAPTSDEKGDCAARLIVAKSRRGRAGFAGARFNGPTGSFTPSDEAVRALSAGTRKAEADTADERAVVSALAGGGMTRESLRAACRGRAKGRTDAAIARLILAGAIEEVPKALADVRGRIQPRLILQLRNGATALMGRPDATTS